MGSDVGFIFMLFNKSFIMSASQAFCFNKIFCNKNLYYNYLLTDGNQLILLYIFFKEQSILLKYGLLVDIKLISI